MNDWISSEEAMKILGVESATIDRMAEDHRLLSMRNGSGKRRFDRADIEHFLHRQKIYAADPFASDAWLQLLIDNSDLNLARERITELRSQFGDYFKVGDFLGAVLEQIGLRWADGECSVAEEHIASRRLDLALAMVTSSIEVPDDAPVCRLASLSGEHHAFGVSLAELCLKSAGINVVWIGVDTPLNELIEHIETNDQRLLGVSASNWSADYLFLTRAYQKLAVACRAQNTELILGGTGAWPGAIEYGYRCRSFAGLQNVLQHLDLTTP